VCTMAEMFHWLNEHDIPNWASTAFSLFVWPIALAMFYYWLSKRKRPGIPLLETMLAPSDDVVIAGRQHHAIGIIFTNRTGSVIYLGRARLREVEKAFPVPADAVRDMFGGWRELKFLDRANNYADHELILQTNMSAKTCIPVSRPVNDAFYSLRPTRWRQLFRRPKYFSIEYIAMVGDKRYSVLGIY
jgi:hypothetical protein